MLSDIVHRPDRGLLRRHSWSAGAMKRNRHSSMSYCSFPRAHAMRLTWWEPGSSGRVCVLLVLFFPVSFCFFLVSRARKVWPLSGPTGSVTVDQNVSRTGRFLASFSGVTNSFFFGAGGREPWSLVSLSGNVC